MFMPPSAISPSEPSIPHQGQADVLPSEHMMFPHSQTTTPSWFPQHGHVGTPRKDIVFILRFDFPSLKLLYVSSSTGYAPTSL